MVKLIIGIAIGILVGSVFGALVMALAVSFKQADSRILELIEEEGGTQNDQ